MRFRIGRYYLISGSMLLFFLLMYILAIILDIDFLKDPTRVMNNSNSFIAAIITIILLTLDILLPIPNSIIMTFNGLRFGFITGTILSLIGLMSSAYIGFYK